MIVEEAAACPEDLKIKVTIISWAAEMSAPKRNQ
jgi:hypothetical protein